MMGKFTVWLVVAGLAWLGWTLWRIGKRRSESGTTRQPDQASSADQPRQAPPTDSPPEPMLRCAHCGLYLPAREAISDTSGRSFCSTAHRDRAGPPSNNTPRQG